MCKWGTYKTVKLCKPRPTSGRTEISVDSCIAPIVQALNDANIHTLASCCGHKRGFGNIALEDGREILICSDYKTGRKIDDIFPDIHGEIK